MHRYVKTFVGILVACFLVSTARADDAEKLKEGLVGKWKISFKVGTSDLVIQIEFTKDNNLKIVDKEKAYAATYKVLDGKTVEINQTEPDEKTHKLEVKIEGDKLTTTDEKGRKDTYSRVK